MEPQLLFIGGACAGFIAGFFFALFVYPGQR